MPKPKSGLYWLCHHKTLLEWVWNEEERRQYINQSKPKSERTIRQLCFQRVKGKLPEKVASAVKAWVKADKARVKADKADKAWVKADKARDKADKVFACHKDKLEAQYAQEYPEAAKYWNGKEIVFPKSEDEL